MSDVKFCVFCGQPPESKNREHVLPQWLLRMTGDPNRVVSMGYHYKGEKEISFSWKSLVTPACESCNNEYAVLEGQVRPIIESILERQPLPAHKYAVLLDWLDKVRVGLWLNYHLIMGNPTDIKPSFFINSRVRKKDRLLAVYPMQGDAQGLNAYGVETLAFHGAPSAFGLRINNVFIMNCSSDYIFSARCGFPYPISMQLLLDGEDRARVKLGTFKATKKIKFPLFKFQLHKPSVLLFQPIMQAAVDEDGQDSDFLGKELLSEQFFLENTLHGAESGVGKIFRQFNSHVSRVDDEHSLIEFDNIQGSECRSAGSLIAQVYALQIYLHSLYEPVTSDLEVRSRWGQRLKVMKKLNRAKASAFLRAGS